MKTTTKAKKIIETLNHIGEFISVNKGKQCSNQFVRWQECQNGDVWGAQQRFLSDCKRRNIISSFMGYNTFTIGDTTFNVPFCEKRNGQWLRGDGVIKNGVLMHITDLQ